MNAQTILDKFEEEFLTIDVLETSDGKFITFNTFDVVPVKCNIRYFWDSNGREVEDVFYVDSVTLDTNDDTFTFELANKTKDMLNASDIIEFEVSKISKNQYQQAIKDDEDLDKFFD